MTRTLISVVLAGFVVGCGDLPTDTEVPAPSSAVVDGNGCYAVSGAVDQVGTPTGLAGTISGDLEGNINTVSGPIVRHGWVIQRPIEQTWEITGGVVEPLIGRTLYCENDFTGILRKYPLIRVNTVVRVVDGAVKGNLTLHGTTDASTVPITSHLDYHGVICP